MTSHYRLRDRRQLALAVGATLLGGVMLACSLGHAQEVRPQHLVGHEEAALLIRIQDVIDDWDPRKLENPLVESSLSEVVVQSKDKDGKDVSTPQKLIHKQLRRKDLAEFIADVDAAEALGKAFFWEMQAGSDFQVTGTGESAIAHGTACASCHYRHGADARNKHTWRIPTVVWEKYKLHPKHNQLDYGDVQMPYPVDTLATQEVPFLKYQPKGPLWLIVGSQGVEPRTFGELEPANGWIREKSDPRDPTGDPEWSMFGTRRQITTRNSPSVINAAFSDRLFHDGRADSTFNGFSIFGDADPREVIHRVKPKLETNGGNPAGAKFEIVPVRIAITKAALASQAVGPIVNEVEMSYEGRQFPNVARKLLDSRILGFQDVSPTDSVLSRYPVGKGHPEGSTYRTLIKQAFRSEWWDDSGVDGQEKNNVPLILLKDTPKGRPVGTLMEGNFSLYWGLSIMLYEASLVSNQSPFDEMMRGRPDAVEEKWKAVKDVVGQPVRRDQKVVDTPPAPDHESGSAVFQHGFRVFMNHGCFDCHGGPFFSELYERQPEAELLPVEYTLERALLPNSRADALAVSLRPFREGLLAKLADLIGQAIPEVKPRAGKLAIELEELRHISAGRKDRLEVRIRHHLQQYPTNNDLIDKCTTLIFDYEKHLIQRMGNRTYFTEDERVAMAEALGGPVLVEKMAIPPGQLATRPKLPIQGPLATQPYAFYDASFYTLGVSPPRYDRGNGSKQAPETTPKERILLDFVSSSFDRGKAENASEQDQKDRVLAIALLDAYLLSGDVEQVEREVLNPGNPKLASYGDAPLRVKEALQNVEDQTSRFPHALETPGSAYQMKAVWRTDSYKSQGPSKNKADFEPAEKQRTPMRGSQKSAKKGLPPSKGNPWESRVDTTWDRIDMPYGAKDAEGDHLPGPSRRAEYHFLSRARRMVNNEEHWGYRKPFLHDNELAFWGAFKTPSLRNVELTAPYMHNGRLMTLRDVLEFYDNRDGDRQIPRDKVANPDKHPAMEDIDFRTDDDLRALEFFLRCLTDNRVRHEQGPFDHPSLSIVNGYEKASDGTLQESLISISSVGMEGHINRASSVFPSEN